MIKAYKNTSKRVYLHLINKLDRQKKHQNRWKNDFGLNSDFAIWEVIFKNDYFTLTTKLQSF